MRSRSHSDLSTGRGSGMTSNAATASTDVGSEEVEEFVREHPRLVKFARIGWISKGIVYTLVGVLALTVAFTEPGQASPEGEASQSGAINRVAQASYGTIALLVIAVGLILYAIWRII